MQTIFMVIRAVATLPQYGIYKKQNRGTKLSKNISSAHSILPKNAFNSPNDHENFVHYLFAWGLPNK
jgi:hypothetical protein